MTQAPSDSNLPSLFTHATRTDWGVGVLAWDDGGKRGYLFEHGEERTMASGFHELMRKVEHPSPAQTAILVRLQRQLAARAGAEAAEGTGGPSFPQQLLRFHEVYPGGLFDPKWVREIRGEGAEETTSLHRAALIRKAQEHLSVKALDALLGSQQFDKVWDLVVRVLDDASDLVPAAHLKKLKVVRPALPRELAVAVRELLHGQEAHAPRFDRYVAALAARTSEPVRWEIATALAALVNPTDDLCIHPRVFGLQLKAMGLQAAIGAKPTGAIYARLLVTARAVAQKLAEQGESPRDLMDVHDFMRVTLKAIPKARVSRAKKPATRKVASTVDDGEQDE